MLSHKSHLRVKWPCSVWFWFPKENPLIYSKLFSRKFDYTIGTTFVIVYFCVQPAKNSMEMLS